jgi:hypothetical protein
MPLSRKKLAAKRRLDHQIRDTGSGQFVTQYSDSEDEYKYESTSSSDNNYSTDSSNEDYCAQRILKLGDIPFVWKNITGLKFLHTWIMNYYFTNLTFFFNCNFRN